MQLALYVNPQTEGPHHDWQVVDEVTEQIKYADEHGFKAIFLTEHHCTGYNAFSDPLLFAAALAHVVKNAWMSFSVATVAFHNPLRFAEHCNMLDNLYKGRFMAGIGSGGGPLEDAAFGLDRATRREVVEEVVNHIVGCWQGSYKSQTAHFNLDVERVIPAPYSSPHPKMARGVVSEASLEDTARRGWPIFLGRFQEDKLAGYVDRYRAALDKAGHDQATKDFCLDWVTALKIVHVAETDEAAMARARPYILRYLVQSAKANSADFITEEQAGESADDFIARAAIIGSPETVARRLQQHADAGVPNVMIWTTFGEMPHETVMASLKLVVDEVMPRIGAGVPRVA